MSLSESMGSYERQPESRTTTSGSNLQASISTTCCVNEVVLRVACVSGTRLRPLQKKKGSIIQKKKPRKKSLFVRMCLMSCVKARVFRVRVCRERVNIICVFDTCVRACEERCMHNGSVQKGELHERHAV
jgi:hypothetical protein